MTFAGRPTRFTFSSALHMLLTLVAVLLAHTPMAVAEGEVATPNRASKLTELGMVAYPTAPDSRLDAELVKVRPLATDAPNADFSNLDDLAWLAPIARRNRMVLLGETHYAATTYQLAARILFALNSYDHYAVSLEVPYSRGAFFQHYVDLTDDEQAQAFRREVLARVTSEEETMEFLDHVRRWNRAHPKRHIAVGAHDLEHDGANVLYTIVVPALKAAKLDCPLPDSVNDETFAAVLKTVRGCLARRRDGGRFGPHPFITAAYLTRVIDNLASTSDAYRTRFDETRQRAIVRNLTDRRFFLPSWRGQKLLLWVGDAHATKRDPPAARALAREGVYFNRDYPATRGRTHAVHIFTYALSMGAMAGVELNAYSHVGSGYRSLLERYEKAAKDGLATAAESFLYDWTADDLDYLWLAQARVHGDRPILVESMDWKRAAAQAAALDQRTLRGVAEWEKGQQGFDSFIVVPKSRITRAVRSAAREP